MPSDGNPSFYHIWAVMDIHPKSVVMDIHAPSRLVITTEPVGFVLTKQVNDFLLRVYVSVLHVMSVTENQQRCRHLNVCDQIHSKFNWSRVEPCIFLGWFHAVFWFAVCNQSCVHLKKWLAFLTGLSPLMGTFATDDLSHLHLSNE